MSANKNGVLVAVSIILVAVIAVGLGFLASMWSYSNQATKAEVNIGRFDSDRQNVLSAYTLKIKEMAQVPDKYKADLQDVIKATFEGRYGADGSKAVFQFIQEKNLNLDSKLYQNLQVAMEAGRNNFQLAQTKVIDACANYEGLRNYVVSGFFVELAGFPKKNIGKLCQTVVDVQTKQTFESGVAEAIKL